MSRGKYHWTESNHLFRFRRPESVPPAVASCLYEESNLVFRVRSPESGSTGRGESEPKDRIELSSLAYRASALSIELRGRRGPPGNRTPIFWVQTRCVPVITSSP